VRGLAAVAALATVVASLLAGPIARSAPDPIARASALPPAYFDAADAGTILDLYGARFGQTDKSDLSLVIRTHKPWAPADIQPLPVRMLCLWLRSDASPAPNGRLCATPDERAKSGVGLRWTALDERGNRLGIRTLAVEVRRPRATMLTASFSPGLLRLAPGRYHWQVRSTVDGVEDRLPNDGELKLDIAISAAPAARLRCFGAASRDPRRRCVNTRLRTAIVPPPEDAVFSQNSPCTPLSFEGVLAPCEFGVVPASARATIALVGDSHASHWRAALEYVAQHKRWRGVSITRSGCPLMRAQTKLEPQQRRAECVQWNDQVPRWFVAHPAIHTVFVVAHRSGSVVVKKGSTAFDTKVAGFRAAWRTLPKSVKRIVVIRDTPIVGYQANECVRQAQAKRRNAGHVCAVERSDALLPDPAVVAARRLRSPRVRVIDMTRFLCSAKRCFPVIGGALVYKDDQHMTDVFATTLGPFLRRAVDRTLR